MTPLTVITYSSMGQDVAQRLVLSCQKFGYPLTFIGQNTWFVNFRQIKIDLVLESLRTITTEYTLYTDAPDSWFLRGDLMKIYRSFFKDEIVVSGNRDHYPETKLYDMKEDVSNFPTDSTFRFICSSQFIGRTAKLIEFFEAMQKNYMGFTDQEGWHVMKVKNLLPFTIDSRCRLFLNMTGVDSEELSEDFTLKETGIKPCSIHFGGAKGDSPNAKNMERVYSRWQTLST